MKITKIALASICSLLASIGLAGNTFAQSGNDFFGSSVPSGGGGAGSSQVDRPPGVAAAEQAALKSGGGDYTVDEKRMQKKYKANMRAAEELISKAEKMVKDGEKKKDDKMQKKGKILKEVAEKRLNELKENNPMSDNR